MECGGESDMMAYLWIYSIGKAIRISRKAGMVRCCRKNKPGGHALPGIKAA